MCEDAKACFGLYQRALDATYSKTDVSTRAFSISGITVGIFKYTTCGNYQEFQYHQDNQDGGWTNIAGSMSGATYVDGSKNLEWRFCVVPGDYNRASGLLNGQPAVRSTLRPFGGGVLLLSSYLWEAIDGTVHVFERYHDDEDSGNANQIKNLGGLSQAPDGSIGASKFNKNTFFTWIFADSQDKYTGLGFMYGVIGWGTTGSYYNSKISVDDEDSNNQNWSRWNIHRTTGYTMWPDQSGLGIEIGNKNTYYYVKYF